MSEHTRLRHLAQLYSMELSYHDVSGSLQEASDQSLRDILRQMSVSADTEEAIEQAIADKERHLAEQVLEPVLVVWEHETPVFTLRIQEAQLYERYRIEVRLENDATLVVQGEVSTFRPLGRFSVNNTNYLDLEVRLPERLPLGYHNLSLELGMKTHETLYLSAPRTAFSPSQQRLWGLFAPTYALWSSSSMGGGSLAELGQLIDFTLESGGQVVGTLPLAAAYLDEPFQPSPYVPVSKLFWNELFVDLPTLVQSEGSEKAEAKLNHPDYKARRASLQSAPQVDYRAQAKLQKEVLGILSEEAFMDGSPSREAIEQFVLQHPRVSDYAQFRAVSEKLQSGFPAWPERLKNGRIDPTDYREEDYRYHVYAQWSMHKQLSELSVRAKAGNGAGLYLDLPLGVHPDGYDAWREKEVFIPGVNAGAPPDALGPDGQDWGFRPFHPEKLRASGYRYLIDTLREQMRFAGILRIDHVMGLHRTFCIPWGKNGSEGIYIRYRPHEVWAIVCLESHRNKVMVVGEDLGTVPEEVRSAMGEHKIQRMYVAQFELRNNALAAMSPVPSDVVATVNTHDTPTFLGFWKDHDLEDRALLGNMTPQALDWAKQERGHLKSALCEFLRRNGVVGEHPSEAEIYRGIIEHVAKSEAKILLLNAEDLWLELNPQNTPGTTDDIRANWRRKAAFPIDTWRAHDDVRATLARLRAARPSS